MAYDDFNPLDLSAYNHQKPVDKKVKKPEKKPEKAVVRRVGIGPLLHSRFTKIFVFFAFLFFLAFGSYAFTQWWILRHG